MRRLAGVMMEVFRAFVFCIGCFLFFTATSGKSEISLLPQRLPLNDVEAFFQVPTSVPLRGVVFLAHGCSHSAGDFWPASPACSDCLGLPIELQIVRLGLSRGYAMIAVSSHDRRSKCWREQDVVPVSLALRAFYATTHLSSPHATTGSTAHQQLPLYLLGASSGGRFVSLLSQHRELQPLRVSAVCVQISPPTHPLPPHIRAPDTPPPTQFVLMDRDQGLVRWVRSFLEQEGRKEDELLLVFPSAITPQFFLQHANITISSSIFQALQRAGLLDERGFLIEDPRRSRWREALAHDNQHAEGLAVGGVAAWLKSRGDDLVPDRSAVSELLNVAYAQHEIVAELMDRTLDFFAKHST